MKITFLGTSHGVPTAERNCSCTMLEINDSIYIIDAGAPVVEELLKRKKEIDKVKAVFTTHCHGDHTAGLFNMASLVDWYYEMATVEFYLTDHEIRKLAEQYIYVSQYKQPTYERVKFIVVDEGVVYEDENIRVHYILTKHPIHKDSNSPSYGILIEAEGKKVLFSGDLSGSLQAKDFPRIALEESLDVIILEFAHFNYEDVEPYLHNCMTKQLWLNHIYPLSKIDIVDEVRVEYPYPIIIVEDGNEFVI